VGGNPKFFNKYHFTFARVLLTYLYAFQQVHNDKFLVRDNSHVILKDMFKYIQKNIFYDIKNSKELFVEAIWEMFKNKNSHSWNQLITFDSIASNTRDAIIRAIDGQKTEKDKEEEAYIRITSAGRRYLRFISVHFEFFVCRYMKNSLPLFAIENIEYIQADNKYKFEKIIEEVYNCVKRCCLHLHISEEKILANSEHLERKNMLEEKRLFVEGKTHGERIIHQHIGYLDAYRLYLINGPFKNNVVEINKRMIILIRKYLELMKPCDKDCLKTKCFDNCDLSASVNNEEGYISGHFSENSLHLYDELVSCVKIIEKNYNDCNTEITRNFFSKLSIKI